MANVYIIWLLWILNKDLRFYVNSVTVDVKFNEHRPQIIDNIEVPNLHRCLKNVFSKKLMICLL